MKLVKVFLAVAGGMCVLIQAGYATIEQSMEVEEGGRGIPPPSILPEEPPSSVPGEEMSLSQLSALIGEVDLLIPTLLKKATILHALEAQLCERSRLMQGRFLAGSGHLSGFHQAQLATFALQVHSARQLSQRTSELHSQHLKWLQTARQASQTDTELSLCFTQFRELLDQGKQLQHDILLLNAKISGRK